MSNQPPGGSPPQRPIGDDDIQQFLGLLIPFCESAFGNGAQVREQFDNARNLIRSADVFADVDRFRELCRLAQEHTAPSDMAGPYQRVLANRNNTFPFVYIATSLFARYGTNITTTLQSIQNSPSLSRANPQGTQARGSPRGTISGPVSSPNRGSPQATRSRGSSGSPTQTFAGMQPTPSTWGPQPVGGSAFGAGGGPPYMTATHGPPHGGPGLAPWHPISGQPQQPAGPMILGPRENVNLTTPPRMTSNNPFLNIPFRITPEIQAHLDKVHSTMDQRDINKIDGYTAEAQAGRLKMGQWMTKLRAVFTQVDRQDLVSEIDWIGLA